MSDRRPPVIPTPPTHTLTVQKDGARFWHPVGVAWQYENGAITIKLNPMVDLGKLKDGDKLRLYPKDFKSRPQGPKGPDRSGPDNEGAPDFGDDEIPF